MINSKGIKYLIKKILPFLSQLILCDIKFKQMIIKQEMKVYFIYQKLIGKI